MLPADGVQFPFVRSRQVTGDGVFHSAGGIAIFQSALKIVRL